MTGSRSFAFMAPLIFCIVNDTICHNGSLNSVRQANCLYGKGE